MPKRFHTHLTICNFSTYNTISGMFHMFSTCRKSISDFLLDTLFISANVLITYALFCFRCAWMPSVCLRACFLFSLRHFHCPFSGLLHSSLQPRELLFNDSTNLMETETGQNHNATRWMNKSCNPCSAVFQLPINSWGTLTDLPQFLWCSVAQKITHATSTN